MFGRKHRHHHDHHGFKNLTKVPLKQQYMIETIETEDPDLQKFLFTLGCYPKQKLTLISSLGENYVIEVHSARYSIDRALARCILVKELD